MSALFALFTYLQFNDLSQYDNELWYCWAVVYALCAMISLISFWKILPQILYVTFAIAALLAAAGRSISIEWHKAILSDETNPSGNESGGLLIIAFWMAILAWKLGIARKGNEAS